MIAILFMAFVAVGQASAGPVPASFEIISHQKISGSEKFKKTLVGGLSGLYFDADKNLLYAVSDDRGNKAEPRIYTFSVGTEEQKFSLKLDDVILLKPPQKVVDFEGISILPWGNFLIVSEGDANARPRVSPQILDFKKDGSFVREYEIPSDYKTEKTGKQKKGPRNNFAFEGLTRSPGANEFMISMESALIQEKDQSAIRILRYSMPEAWVLKFKTDYLYPMPTVQEGFMPVRTGISELLWWRETELWVLERTAGLSTDGIGFQVNIYSVDLKAAKAKQNLVKTKLLDFSTLGLSVVGNYEAMTSGPRTRDGSPTLIVVTDNNLAKGFETEILVLKVKGKK